MQGKCTDNVLFVAFSHTSEDFILRTVALEEGDNSFDIFFRILPEDKQVLIMLEKIRNRGIGEHELAEELFHLVKEFCFNEAIIKDMLKNNEYDVCELKDY